MNTSVTAAPIGAQRTTPGPDATTRRRAARHGPPVGVGFAALWSDPMTPRHALLAALAALTLAAAPPSPADLETPRDRILAAVNAARQGEGLPPLRRNALLDGAAQTHADDMAVKGYFALTSPEGVDIDAWVAATGYPARIVAEKLINDTTAPADFAVASRLDPSGSRASLFHPEVTELGVGFAFSSTTRQWLYAFVLARRQAAASAATAGGAPEAPLAELRQRFLAELNRHRRSSGLPSLVEEGALAAAAQAHATELLRARRRGGSRDHLQQLVAPLAERVTAERRGTAASSIRGGSVIWQRHPAPSEGKRARSARRWCSTRRTPSRRSPSPSSRR